MNIFSKFSALLLLLLAISKFTFAVHPSIFVTPSEKSVITEKIKKYAWAKSEYLSWINELEPYITRHKSDPTWITSRLQMFWEERYTNIVITEIIDQYEMRWSNSGRAPVPTIRVEMSRRNPIDENNLSYRTPPLDRVTPYGDGSLLVNTSAPNSPLVLLPAGKTGLLTSEVNRAIMFLAVKASIIYWISGNESYAAFSAAIFKQLMDGLYYQNPTRHINPSDFFNSISGWLCYETIAFASTYQHLPVIYDFLYNYLDEQGENLDRYQTVFKRIAEFIKTKGNNSNNWNAVEAYMLALCGMVLEPDTHYSDNKGRDHYISLWLNESYNEASTYEGHVSMKDYIPRHFNEATGLWDETPGYHEFPVRHILPIALALEKQGYNVFKQFPVLYKSSYALLDIIFPNGFTIGYGDASRVTPLGGILEMAIAAARLNGDPIEEKITTAFNRLINSGLTTRGDTYYQQPVLPLLLYVGKLTDFSGSPEPPKALFIDYSACHIQRNGNDPKYGLMVSLQAGNYNHAHDNGLSTELFGHGFIQSPDPSSDINYNTERHQEYYHRFPAHNTVLVDSKSWNGVNNNTKPWQNAKLLHSEPQSGSIESLVSECSFSELYYDELSTSSDQRRLVGIVRTSEKTGYYIDIFRSRKRSGGDVRHDYIYHNLGHSHWFAKPDGTVIESVSTDLINGSEGHPGYEYFFNKKSGGNYNDDFTAIFKINTTIGSPVFMRMWMAGASGRTLFSMMGPEVRNQDKMMKSVFSSTAPTPAILVRQTGEAWSTPFVSIFESFEGNSSSSHSIQAITKLIPDAPDAGFQGVRVEHKPLSISLDGRKEVILNHTNSSLAISSGEYNFKGIYGVICERKDSLEYIYLGLGREIGWRGYSLEAISASDIKASIKKEGTDYFYTSDSEISVSIPLGDYTNNHPAGIYSVVNGSLFAGRGVIFFTNDYGTTFIKAILPPAKNGRLIIAEANKYSFSDTPSVANFKLEIQINKKHRESDSLFLSKKDLVEIRLNGNFNFRADVTFLKTPNGEIIAPDEITAGNVRWSFSVQNENDYGSYFLYANDIFGNEFAVPLTFKGGNSSSIRVFPNPFQYTLSDEISFLSESTFSENEELYIATANGVTVAGPIKSTIDNSRFVWSGRNEAGAMVPDGLYFCIVKNGNETRTSKLIIQGGK